MAKADKEFKCRRCQKKFPALHLLGAHSREEHGVRPYKRRKKRGNIVELPAVDSECALLQKCVDAFEEAATVCDWDALRRVIAHLDARYSPPKAEEETTEGNAA